MPKISNNGKSEYITSNEQSLPKSNKAQLDYCLSYFNALKPKGYDLKQEMNPLEFKPKEKPLSFINKPKFLKQRKKIVQSIKAIVTKHTLSLHTLFLSITYFDIICSQMSSFNELKLISKICLILAAKFGDDGLKAYQLEKTYRSELSSHYQSDEMFIVKLLDYNLNLLTADDFLSELLMSGVIFKNEINDIKKVDFMYKTVIKIALLFIESNSFLELSQSQIAFGIVAFTRKLLGLEAFCPQLEMRYHIKSKALIFNEGLHIIQETFKVNRRKENRKSYKDNKDVSNSKNNETFINNKQYYEMTSVC